MIAAAYTGMNIAILRLMALAEQCPMTSQQHRR